MITFSETQFVVFLLRLYCNLSDTYTLHNHVPLRWRYNEWDGVSNHQLHHCLLSRFSWRRSKKTSKPRVTGLCVGNSPETGEFPAQMASNAETVSIWWRHHAIGLLLHWHPGYIINQSAFEVSLLDIGKGGYTLFIGNRLAINCITSCYSPVRNRFNTSTFINHLITAVHNTSHKSGSRTLAEEKRIVSIRWIGYAVLKE